MKICHILCCAIGIQLLFVLSPTIVATAQPDTTGYSIDSPREALEAAYAYTGFEEITDLLDAEDYSGVEVITLKDSTIPFLIDQVYGKPAWQIRIDQVQPDFGRPSQRKSPTPKDCRVFLDRNTGQFLMATFNVRDSEDILTRPPTAQEAEAQLTALGERYIGLPTQAPPKTLREALETYDLFPPVHEQTTVHYVLYSFRGSEPQAVWIVYERSTRELFPGHAPAPYALANKRTVIHASTGERMLTINRPYPLLEGGYEIESDSQ